METDPRVNEALSHVQRAAFELIAAMRNALDVAEDLVGNPEAVTSMIQAAAAMARDAMDNVTNVASNQGEPVQRIRVDE